MLRKLIAFAITTGVAKKAWDHYRAPQRRLPVDLTDVIARPAASDQRRGLRKIGARRRREGPAT
jgi:hypothetical protein